MPFNNVALSLNDTIRPDSRPKRPKNVVGDPTDPKGTLRLNLGVGIGDRPLRTPDLP